MPLTFDWARALSAQRLRRSSSLSPGDVGNDFLSDYYRVVFSSPFRRLQDKTQVNPLAKTDFVRRRLTHSIEVATIGERMGRVIATELDKRIGANLEAQKDVLGKIVATACLLHDIGNPPFGHQGEVAIREWADRRATSLVDYRCFDGNAQSFRIAVRLHHHGEEKGMNLTAATLATMLKYPTHARLIESVPAVKRGGYCVMGSERVQYDEVREIVGLPAGTRHPLSFLMEAADDIVNRLIDLEDGMKIGLVTMDEVRSAIEQVAGEPSEYLLAVFDEGREKLSGFGGREGDHLAFLRFRVKGITAMAQACERVFVDRIEEFEAGTVDQPLIRMTEYADIYEALRKLEYGNIFGDPRIVRVEAGGAKAIAGLLDSFLEAVRSRSKLADTVPVPMYFSGEDPEENGNEIRRVVDYVAGMTDSFAVRLFQEVSGMSL